MTMWTTQSTISSNDETRTFANVSRTTEKYQTCHPIKPSILIPLSSLLLLYNIKKIPLAQSLFHGLYIHHLYTRLHHFIFYTRQHQAAARRPAATSRASGPSATRRRTCGRARSRWRRATRRASRTRPSRRSARKVKVKEKQKYMENHIHLRGKSAQTLAAPRTRTHARERGEGENRYARERRDEIAVPSVDMDLKVQEMLIVVVPLSGRVWVYIVAGKLILGVVRDARVMWYYNDQLRVSGYVRVSEMRGWMSFRKILLQTWLVYTAWIV